MRLTDAAIAAVADALGCTPAHVRAVIAVESAGSGFLPDGRPKVLFEAHWFSRLTDRRFDAAYPGISCPKWNRELYRGGAAEWDRIEAAAELDHDAAYQSASYGAFQVMGFHWETCGFSDVDAFVATMEAGEAEQLALFGRFILGQNLDDDLRAGGVTAESWRPFAKAYNGPGYGKNAYDSKLAGAFRSAGDIGQEYSGEYFAPENFLLRMGAVGPAVLRLQRALNERTDPDVTVDGIFGRETELALIFWQRISGLKPDGIAGPETLASLQPEG